MVCPRCGKSTEDGKNFCNHCGAPLVPAKQPTSPQPPPAQPPAPQPPVAPAGPPARPPGQWVPPPQPPPPVPGQPTSWEPETQPTWGGPPTPPPKSGGGWTTAVIVVSIIAIAVIAGIILFGGGGEDPTTETSSVVTGTVPTESTLPPASDTDGTVDGSSAYVVALDQLDGTLQTADERVGQLDELVNTTAPDVPRTVYAELQAIQDAVETDRERLGQTRPPSEYAEADQAIFSAAESMGHRIEQTMLGIEAMWNSGTVEAAAAYFDDARAAHDQYRQLYAQYEEARP